MRVAGGIAPATVRGWGRVRGEALEKGGGEGGALEACACGRRPAGAGDAAFGERLYAKRWGGFGSGGGVTIVCVCVCVCVRGLV